MDIYQSYMVEHVIETIKSIEDPLLLSICIRAIIAQRCKIGSAKEGTCKGCRFQGHYCRELYNINVDEIKRFGGDLYNDCQSKT